MFALNYTPASASVKPAACVTDYATGDMLIALPPLADGTSVQGTFDDTGNPNGVDAEWRGLFISIGYNIVHGGESSVDVYFDEESLTVADWSQRRKDMSDLIERNIIEQVIDRARAWQPHLFVG